MARQTTVGSILSNTSNSHRAQLTETKGIVNKWSRTGLLEGLSAEYEKHGMGILLENQAKQLIDEASRTGTSGNSEEWSGVALPLVRRVFAEIAAKEFVSVQPMNLPSGLIFYLDYKYGTDNGTGFTTSAGKDSQKDSVFGETDQVGDPTKGLYGSGQYGYSVNFASSSANRAFTTGSLSGTDYNFNSVFSQSYAGQFHGADGNAGGATGVNHVSKRVHYVRLALTQIRTQLPSGADSAAVTYDLNSAKSWHLTNLQYLNPNLHVFKEFTKLCDSAGNETQPDAASHIQFIVSGSQGNGAVLQTAGSTMAVKFQQQPTDIARGDFEDGQEGRPKTTDNLAIPEINLEMKSIAIVAKTRKLKAIWTPEFAQDLNAYHSIDAEAELTSMLS